MAKIGICKRKSSSSKSLESMSSRMSSPDVSCDIKPPLRKRRKSTLINLDYDSSNDSFSNSNYVPSEGGGSSDSEFEEHPYSRSPCQFNKESNNPQRPIFNSDSSNNMSKFETNTKTNKRSKCTSKNAVMARINRQKKKKYIENLETKNEELEAENQMLKNMLDSRAKEVLSLKKKTLNLENVIRNKTEIGTLLRCVQQHTNLEISSSLMKPSKSNAEVNLEELGSRNPNELVGLVPPSEEEALVAAILWGMALHTFCQPYKPRTSAS